MFDPAQFQIAGYTFLAMILGGIIGLDREIANKPAGLRTHMFVAGASALFVLIGHMLVSFFEISLDKELIRSDPIRIVEAVITGVSFLAAGTIIQHSDKRVRGLTTAASLLLSAAVGVCVALFQIILAICIAAMAVLSLNILGLIEKQFISKEEQHG